MHGTPAIASSHADQRRIRAGRLSFGLGILIFAGKIAAYAITDSVAVYSDAMESIVNIVAAAVLWFTLIVSARPADRDHPYGHGKVEFFSAGVEGAMIAVAAGLILVEAVREIITGPQIQNLNQGVVIVTAATLVNAGLGLYLIRVGRNTDSLALVADGRHLMTDVATSLGVVVGLGAVALTGWTLLDPLIAIAIALNILRTGGALLRESVGGLMDEADVLALGRMVDALDRGRQPWCIDVHTLRAWRSGAERHVDLHMVVPRYFDVERVHDIGDEVDGLLLEALGGSGEVIVHFDPCRPRQCAGCVMPDCAIREAPSRGREPLTLELATRRDEVLETGSPVAPP